MFCSAYELYVANTADHGREAPGSQNANIDDDQESIVITDVSQQRDGDGHESTPADIKPKAPKLKVSELKTEDVKSISDPSEIASLCRQFKRTLCHKHVGVHFVGAWWVSSWLELIMANVAFSQGHRLVGRTHARASDAGDDDWHDPRLCIPPFTRP